MHEAIIKGFCLQADLYFDVLYVQISCNKIYINEYLNRDIVVY